MSESAAELRVKLLERELAARTAQCSEPQALQDLRAKHSAKEMIAVEVYNEVFSVNRAASMNFAPSFTPVAMDTIPGLSVYRQSVCFLLGMACHSLHPKLTFTVEHAFGVESSRFGSSYYCAMSKNSDVGEDDHPMTDEDVVAIEAKMRELVAQNLPIEVVQEDVPSLLEYFKSHAMPYSHVLLTTRGASTILINRCLDFRTVYLRPLAPALGVLDVFSLQRYQDGMVVSFPSVDDVSVPRPFTPNTPMHEVWKLDNARWNSLEIGSVGELNKCVMEGRARRVVQLSEAAHDSKIVAMAKAIHAKKNVKLVLIAGPSSSGKTTFASKLSVHLELLGLKPLALSVDDYYRDHREAAYPRDENGNLDFECIDALRLPLFNDHLNKLFNGEEVEVPEFNFKTGAPKEHGVKRRLPAGGVLVCEGIFCLNPKLTEQVAADKKFNIYIAPMSQLNVDEHAYFSNQVVRTIRRISRDYIHRGRDAQQTLHKWESVRAGEERNIFPNMKHADAVFNSSLEYEMPVLSVFVVPLLSTVPPESPIYQLARQLHGFLSNFHPIPAQLVPSTSLLREFIGGSDFE